MKKLFKPLLYIFLLSLLACGDEIATRQLREIKPMQPRVSVTSTTPAGCIPGQSEACACPNGRMGSQVCTVMRTYTACVCQDEPDMSDAGVGQNPDATQGYPDAVAPPPPPPSSPAGTEGYACEIDPISNAELCDEGLECYRMSSASETDNPISICIRACATDSDCSSSQVGNNLCREIRNGQNACVSGEVEEGEIAELSLRRGGPMTGCSAVRSAGDAYLVGISYWSGSGLWQLEHDQSSCVRKCEPGDPMDCNAEFPYCNAPFFSDGTGVCSTGHKKSGARCSRLNGSDMCSQDASIDGDLVCWDYLGSHSDSSIGQCMQLCSISAQDCKNSHDSSLTPRCLDMGVSPANPDRGICSDECGRYPDNCAGAGTHGAGQNCSYGFLRSSTVASIDNPSLSFCWDIEPPVLGLWENGTTFDNCYNKRFSCPNGAHCETNGFTGPRGGCFYGCTTASDAPTTGCEDKTINGMSTTCQKARTPQFDAGRCMP